MGELWRGETLSRTSPLKITDSCHLMVDPRGCDALWDVSLSEESPIYNLKNCFKVRSLRLAFLLAILMTTTTVKYSPFGRLNARRINNRDNFFAMVGAFVNRRSRRATVGSELFRLCTMRRNLPFVRIRGGATTTSTCTKEFRWKPKVPGARCPPNSMLWGNLVVTFLVPTLLI